MKIEKIYLLLVSLIIFSFCLAEEEIIMPVEGLEVYTLDSVKNSNSQESEWNLTFKNLTMDDYKGFGSDFQYKNKNSVISGYNTDYMINSKFDGSGESILVKYSLFFGKEFTFNDLIFIQVNHSFNLISLEYEFDNYNYYFAYDSIFCPSIDYNFGLSVNLLDNFNLFYTNQNSIWYTSPKFKMELDETNNDFNVKVSDVYKKSQHSMGITIKF